MWTCWEQAGDPYPFKADAPFALDRETMDRLVLFCQQSFGHGEASSGNVILVSTEWRWLASRYVLSRSIATDNVVDDPNAPPPASSITVTRFSFRSEVDRVMFVLGASEV